MYAEVPPQSAAEAVIRHRESVPASDIVVSWLTVEGDRARYREDLLRALGDARCAVICLRSHGFNNANALMSDLMELLDHERGHIESEWCDAGPPLQIAVLAKTPLSTPILASPSLAPHWVPSVGGRMAQVHVADITLNSSSSLSAPESGTSGVSLPLYELEGALIERLELVGETQTDKLLLALQRLEDGRDSAIAKYRSTHLGVLNASRFRPSRRDQNSLVSDLWRLHERTSPEVARKTADALACALDLPLARDHTWTVSYFGLLKHGGWRSDDWRIEFAADVLCVLSVSCQLLSVAGHTDRSPSFGVQLLKSGSTEMVSSLRTARRVLLGAAM